MSLILKHSDKKLDNKNIVDPPLDPPLVTIRIINLITTTITAVFLFTLYYLARLRKENYSALPIFFICYILCSTCITMLAGITRSLNAWEQG